MGSIEDGATLGGERGSYPAYVPNGADGIMETLTYRNDLQPTEPGLNTTDFDTAAWTSTAGFSDSSLPVSQRDSYIDADAYGSHIANYDPKPLDPPPGFPAAVTSTWRTSSYQTYAVPGADYATTTPVPDITTPYTHPETGSYSIPIAPSPPLIDSSHTSDDAFGQGQGPQSHVSQDSYGVSSGRRWSTDNQQGSDAGSPERTMPGIMETQLEGEETSERLRGGSIDANTHDTSNSYLNRARSGNADGNAENN
ncbi:hypothetical protein ABKA04_007469 [Annulohypoxylon sp. FPYF3050]